ncbi:ATP-binding protein [Oceanospirillum sediminis]|uniref:ATP-binding protein n=1 Tax=Oceanospirillum sediminis TaxID=2760088 RepID=A0A839IXT4_9GAMM|nr:ATP-binding protein [Oceanospirillum sediminis]MBB1489187.1 ATP-binding protein [Oceanospirillum sediminis]
MGNMAISGTADITHEGIKKHFTKWKKYPFQSVIELIANGFDSGATSVDLTIEHNEMHGLVAITVLDNGSGIDIKKCDQHFSRFNESSKQGDDDLQGAHGKGRLAFHLLCSNATWYTKCHDSESKILIDSTKLRNFSAKEIAPEEQHALLSPLESGTCVVLSNFHTNLPELEVIKSNLESYFGWRLILNPDRKLTVNGVEVEIPENELIEKNICIDGAEFKIDFIRWVDKPGDEKSYNYVVNHDGRVLHRDLSSFNKKPKFHLSSYSRSNWFDNFNKSSSTLNFTDAPQVSPESDAFKKLKKAIHEFSREIYEKFLREFVEEKIEEYEARGYFPEHKRLKAEEAAWRRENTKSFVKSLYITDPAIFNNIKEKPVKILLALIDKILVSNENDTIFEVIGEILNLDENQINTFSQQVKNSSLENVISTIEVLQKRELAVHKLREIMVKYYKEVLETPDLQGIIESNTWLFGNKYTLLGAEEDDFQKISLNLRNHVKGIDSIDESDVESVDLDGGLDIEGVRRQVDLFLARKNIGFNSRGESYYQCTIIEIKRPAVALNEKHLKQIRDYARIISEHSGFSMEKMRFEIILVGRKISDKDFDINSALETADAKNEPGLVFSTKNDRIKGYVKTWGTIFAEFDLANHYLLEKLQTKRGSLEDKSSKQLVDELQEPSE